MSTFAEYLRRGVGGSEAAGEIIEAAQPVRIDPAVLDGLMVAEKVVPVAEAPCEIAEGQHIATPVVSNAAMVDSMSEIEEIIALTRDQSVVLKRELLKLALQAEAPGPKLGAIKELLAHSTLNKLDRLRNRDRGQPQQNIFNVVSVVQAAQRLADQHNEPQNPLRPV